MRGSPLFAWTLVALLLAGSLLAAGRPRSVAARQDATPGASPVSDELVGPDELVLRVEIGGGFALASAFLTELPVFSLYGDGRVVAPGPMIMIYPPPALPNLRLSRLTEEGVRAVLDAARDAGLLDGDRLYRHDQIADAPTTTFTVVADGRTTVVSAVALGLAEDTAPPADRAARAELTRFLEQLGDLSNLLPSGAVVEQDAEYPVERLQVVAHPADTAASTDPAVTPDPALAQAPAAWPLDTPLADLGQPFAAPNLHPDTRCAVLDGEDAARLVAALQNANTLTPWESDGQVYALYPRPLLPDETGCRGDQATPTA